MTQRYSGARRRGSVVTSSNAGRMPEWPTTGHVSAAELARSQGIGPIASMEDLARPDLLSDDELNALLADLNASRRSDQAIWRRSSP